jgi:xanthine phosphoribosyltransferase
MIHYEYNQFKNDVPSLAALCASFHPDTLVAVARGGMTLAHALSMALDVRNLQSIRIESYDGDHQRDTLTIQGECDLSLSKKVLIIDDIVDSGQTLDALLQYLRIRYPDIEFKSAAIYTKHSASIQPEYSLHEATDWIDFFWERDFLK